MLLTPISLDVRPLPSVGAFDNPSLSIAADVALLGEMQTDVPVSGGVAGLAGTLYVATQMFQQVGAPALPNAIPSGPHFALAISGATATNTPLAMVYVGTNAQQNGAMAVEIDDSGVNFVLRFTGDITMLEDVGSPAWLNSRRLLFTTTTEVTPLSNSAPSVYSTTRELRLAVRHLAGATWSAGDLIRNRASKWYDSDPFNTVPTDVSNLAVSLFVGAQPATQISSVERTEVLFTFDSALPQARVLVGLIRTDSSNNSATWFDSYAGGFAYLINQPANTPLPAHRGLPIIAGPASVAAPTTPPEWQGAFVIDPASVAAGATYRFVFVIYYQPAGFDEDSYSFITPEYATLNELTACPPAISARIIDYRAQHPSILQGAANYERLRSESDWDGASYLACRTAKGYPQSLQDAAQSMRVRIYEEVGPNRRVYADELALKSNANTITGANVNATWDGTQWQAVYDFRVRWEGNLPNLYDLGTSGNVLPATGTQDWAGKQLWIEWLFTLTHATPSPSSTELVLRQQLNISSQSACYTFQYQTLDGTLIRTLCSGAGTIRALITSCGTEQPTDQLIWAIVPQNYTLPSIREYEDWAGLLTQLQQSPILAGDVTWDINGQAVVEIDTTNLLPLLRYRLIIINKRQVTPPVEPCEDCFSFVGAPLDDEDLFALADCFLFDMRNNDLS